MLDSAIDKTGVDLTETINIIESIPDKIVIPNQIFIKGELYISRKNINRAFKNSKKFLIDSKIEIEELNFCAYEIINCELNHFESLKLLDSLGFRIPETESTCFLKEVDLYKLIWLQDNLFFNYPTNGIILKVNSKKLQKQLGESKGIAKWKCLIAK